MRQKKAKEPSPARFAVEETQRPYPELYREHFIFWRSWHGQLIQDLNTNHKKELQDMREARRHLIYLEKYLKEDQAKMVRELTERFDQLTAVLKRPRLSDGDYTLLGRRLDALHRRIDRSLHYKDMKPYLLPTPVSMDMQAYEDEEPDILQPKDLKEGVGEADTDKDEDTEYSYEKFRELSPS